MYIRKEIREFIKKIPKEMKKPRHWRKFINENDINFNLLIKHGKEYECTNCGKYFNSQKIEGEKDICPFCKNKYKIRRSNLKNYFFLYDLAIIDNIDNKLVLRYFEVKREYNYKTRRFISDVVEYARIVPELDIELVNDRFIKYLAAEYVRHLKRFKRWRIFTGMYGLNQYYRAVYLENINEKLKGTAYQYAQIKEAIEYLGNNRVNLLNIIDKAKYSSFELLMKSKLYKLALENPEQFNKKGSFEKRFGIGKEYYNFMKKHNISTNELKILRQIKRKNIKIIRDIIKMGNMKDIKKVSKYVKIEKLLEYKKKQKIFSLPSYLDYIENLEKLGVPIEGKRILYPSNFIEAHNEIFTKVDNFTNNTRELNEKISKRYEQLKKNCYSNKKYFIRPADSLQDLRNEAKQQDNCVYRNYSESYASGKTDIYFLRENKVPNKSVVTIEVNKNKIRQKARKNHRTILKEQKQMLDFWEKNILEKVA